MYAGRVECCPLLSHVEYVQTYTQTNVRQTVTLRLPLDAASVISFEQRLYRHVKLRRIFITHPAV